MAVPPGPSMSPASMDLGLGGQLSQQVTGETDEQRKKRMAQMQQQQMMGPAGSMSVTSLFGSRGGAPGVGSY